MVEATSKPTDISKIQDILKAINSGGNSDKTGLKVDYAAGSNLETGINELRKIGERQVGYLKQMVMYQDSMIQRAKRDDVSSAASNAKNNASDGTSKGPNVYAAAGSAALMSALGPLGPVLGNLLTGLGGLATGSAGARLMGGGGKVRMSGGAGGDRLRTTGFELGGDYDKGPFPRGNAPPRLLTVDERLAAQRMGAPRIASSNSPFILSEDMRVNRSPFLLSEDMRVNKSPFLLTQNMRVNNSPFLLSQDMRVSSRDLKYKAMGMSDAELANAMKTSNSPELKNEFQRRLTLKKLPNLSVPDPMGRLNLTENMRVFPTTPLQTLNPTLAQMAPPTMSQRLGGLLGRGLGAAGRIAGPVGLGVSGYQGYTDQDLKDRGVSERGRITQGIVEGLTGTFDMVNQTLITNPLNATNALINYGLGKLGIESKTPTNRDLSITPAIRDFMVNNILEQEGDAVVKRKQLRTDMDAILRQAVYDPMNPDRDRQRISPNAPDLQVPDKSAMSSAPIVIAPPAAPASSVVNSNNQQTTIINQTKDVSASLYLHMLGGN